MSRFFSKKFEALVPYTPGEQPKDRVFIKLNTNESPFPPSKKAIKLAGKAAKKLQLYPDPTCAALTRAVAENLGVGEDEVLLTNGSDDILNFAFMAYCDAEHPAVFPDITYGFYSVFAEINGVPYKEIPLKDDFTIDIEDYIREKGTVFIANPNAPTGILLSPSEIEKLVKADPDRIVVVDEAYVDFGGESCVPLTKKYDNLFVTRTFSKSRSMAGARLGFGVGCRDLIRDLDTLKYSTNPYTINAMTMAAGLGTMADEAYTLKNCQTVSENREETAKELKALGFVLTDSRANFLFAKHPKISGQKVYEKLREKGILVRHFTAPRICDYNRITVGSRKEMKALITALSEIVEEQ